MTAAGGNDGLEPPIRVCMVSFFYEPNFSGSAIQAGNLSRYLQRRNVEPFVVSAMLDSKVRHETLHGIPVYRIPVLKSKNFQIPSFWIGLLWFLWRHRRDWEIVHAHGTLQHGTASIIARMLGKGSILKVAMHRSDIAFGGQGRIWGRVNRFYVRRFHRYIATSRQIYQEFVEEGVAREKVVQLPNGVDMERFRPAESEAEKIELKEKLGLPPVPVALFAGIVLARKNVEFVLRVFLRIRENGLPGHLVIAGPGEGGGDQPAGPYFDRLQQMIRAAGMEADVTFTGRVGNIEEYIRASDMFLFAPRKEGMPNVLLEAMSGGLPCVVSRISGIEDVIESGVNGFIFDLANESDYTEMVTTLFTNRELRAEVGKRARNRIRSRFSLDRVADEYCRIYRELRHDTRSV